MFINQKPFLLIFPEVNYNSFYSKGTLATCFRNISFLSVARSVLMFFRFCIAPWEGTEKSFHFSAAALVTNGQERALTPGAARNLSTWCTDTQFGDKLTIFLRSSCITEDLITQPSIRSRVSTHFSLYPYYSGLDKLLFKPNRLSCS